MRDKSLGNSIYHNAAIKTVENCNNKILNLFNRGTAMYVHVILNVYRPASNALVSIQNEIRRKILYIMNI